MKKSFIITGTDTGIGKTLISAILVKNLSASYWKPIQSGLTEETDSQWVKRISECKAEQILPEAYRLQQPLSPHISADLDGIKIQPKKITIPKFATDTLIMEGAGGVLVPINWQVLEIELFQQLHVPVVIVCRTSLGTINHSLLTIESLKIRNIPIHGVIFNGEFNQDNADSIVRFGNVKLLGHVPVLKKIDKKSLTTVFKNNFNKSDWL